MERRMKKKIDEYLNTFKTDIITELGNHMDEQEVNVMKNMILNYDSFELVKEDFLKRKRVKNMVPMFDRCYAKRANGEQCTRRKKDGSEFCGTHTKGTPHGKVSDVIPENNKTRIEVFATEIQGIVYYIDKHNNVYDPQDVLANSSSPKIIAKCKKEGETYSIEQFNT
tara:strand:- start:4358 stop:4861 length:504 start_codon:yes stop_codon:yes gene_type:complete